MRKEPFKCIRPCSSSTYFLRLIPFSETLVEVRHSLVNGDSEI